MLPEFTPEALIAMVAESDKSKLPLDEGQTRGELLDMLRPVMFDPDVAAKKVTLDPDVDQVVNSATNYYSGVTANDVEGFYSAKVDDDPERPVSWGLNSQLAKVDGEIVERVWKIGGMYGPAIEKVVYWLEKASAVAENDTQRAWIDKLVEYYRTGDLRDFDEFNIAWVADTASRIDAINGFIEVYAAAPGSPSCLSAISRQPSVSQRSAPTRNGSKTTRRSWTSTRKIMLSVFPRRSLPWSCRAVT
jgi:dipeptidyl-peptidase-3